MSDQPRAYVAGPLFDEGERFWIEKVEQLVVAAGFVTFLPHRDNPPKDQFNVRQIFENDKRGIDTCDVVVANLNGIMTDDGTAWELGYAYANGKHLIGMHTDWRKRFDHEVVNLMLECSLHRMVHSLEELQAALAEFRAAH
ncbi:MAG: nucleoside 2-deoxyribosyltransferase [Actinomycetota bacterium]|nr:nucleoside 2-deoxyribosyltransferase [Actinomycetota bacterium]